MEAVRSLLNTTHWMNSTTFSVKLMSPLIDHLFVKEMPKDLMQKTRLLKRFSVIFILLIAVLISSGQKVHKSNYEDSLPAAKVDSLIKAQHSPRKAAIRS